MVHEDHELDEKVLRTLATDYSLSMPQVAKTLGLRYREVIVALDRLCEVGAVRRYRPGENRVRFYRRVKR